MIEERIRLNRIRREQELRRHILLFVVSAAIILVLAIAGGSFISRAQAPGETVRALSQRCEKLGVAFSCFQV